MNRDFRDLRQKLDGNDPFMTGGHQVLKTAGATQHARRMLRVPVWARDDSKVREIILTAFPKLATDEKQRDRAGRWTRIIYLYYRVGETYLSIAEQLRESPNAVYMAIRKINHVAAGKNSLGNQRKRRGRPRKKIL